MARILVAEDDAELVVLIRRWLELEGHGCDHVKDGREASLALETSVYELVILDLGLPESDGLEVLRKYRRTGGKTPVLILTGKGEIEDKLAGFRTGADDYLTKPFDGRELIARVSALLRRPADFHGEGLRTGPLELVPSLHAVKLDGKKIALVRREYALLQFFMRYPNQLFGPDRILDAVWSNKSEGSYEALTSCVKRLRKKLDRPDQPSLIKNVHGVGYGLFPEGEPD